jgi:hypothetical protein
MKIAPTPVHSFNSFPNLLSIAIPKRKRKIEKKDEAKRGRKGTN